jgi:hypothetical protein
VIDAMKALSPVATTNAVPQPEMTLVPMKAILSRSKSDLFNLLSISLFLFDTGSLSPVRLDCAIWR